MISRTCPLGSSQYTPRPPSLNIGLTRPTPAEISPVRQPAGPDPVEDLVEVGLADQKCVVLRVDRAVVVGKVQRQVVVDMFHHRRDHESHRRQDRQDLVTLARRCQALCADGRAVWVADRVRRLPAE